ncbi:MAG TPA: ABC transporter substrate-binding protein [Candidatus Limnocylindrales bacterium]|nr:ABC transporter substrate-binding protein [Candidatus Limnocylindrales bacterium]
MTRMRRIGGLVVLGAVTTLLTTGAVIPGGAPGVRAAVAEDDRTLRVGTTEEFDSINPNLAFIGSSAEASLLQYDALVGLGPDMEYASTGFAEAWALDGTTWTFTIRDGMRWSDGQVADANDVAFTFQYLLSSMDPTYIGPWAPQGNDLPRAGATRGDGRPDHPLSLYGKVLVEDVGLRSVQLVDDHTVTLTTAEPTTLLLGAMVPILPAHIWSIVPFSSATTDFGTSPPVIGSGPFQIVEWQRGTSARFVRNGFSWREQPYIDTVEFRFYRDASAMAAALRRGEIDYARGIAPRDFDGLDDDPEIVGVQGAASRFTHLAFNTYAQPIDGGGASTSAVRDPAFRDALGYALDADAIIGAAVNGHATPGTTLIPPAVVPFHTEPARPRRFDADEARARLEAAGYRDADEDGIREDLDGKPVDLRLVYPTSDRRFASAAVAVASQWEAVGVGVTPEGLEPDPLEELLYTPEAGGTAEYDVELWSWTGSPDPDFLLSLLTTAAIGGYSDSNYANPAYDSLFAAQRRAATLGDRQGIVRRMLDLAYDEAPYLVLFYDDELHAHRTDRFGPWTTQPRAGGVSLFTAGVQGYLDLVPAADLATPSPAPSPTAVASPTPLPSATAMEPGLTVGMTDATIGLAGALLAVAAVTLVMIGRRMRRGGRT